MRTTNVDVTLSYTSRTECTEVRHVPQKQRAQRAALQSQDVDLEVQDEALRQAARGEVLHHLRDTGQKNRSLRLMAR